MVPSYVLDWVFFWIAQVQQFEKSKIYFYCCCTSFDPGDKLLATHMSVLKHVSSALVVDMWRFLLVAI